MLGGLSKSPNKGGGLVQALADVRHALENSAPVLVLLEGSVKPEPLLRAEQGWYKAAGTWGLLGPL